MERASKTPYLHVPVRYTTTLMHVHLQEYTCKSTPERVQLKEYTQKSIAQRVLRLLKEYAS